MDERNCLTLTSPPVLGSVYEKATRISRVTSNLMRNFVLIARSVEKVVSHPQVVENGKSTFSAFFATLE